MGLAIRIDQGKYIPVMVCDTCENDIENWGMAVVTHSTKANTGVVPVHVYHKGDCDQGGVGGAKRSADSGWLQLNYFLPWLIWNNNGAGNFSHLSRNSQVSYRRSGPLPLVTGSQGTIDHLASELCDEDSCLTRVDQKVIRTPK